MGNRKTNQTVLLVVEESIGHHIAFLILFSESLIRLGKNVVVIAPDLDKFRFLLNPKILLFEKDPSPPKKDANVFLFVLSLVKKWKSLSNQIRRIEKEQSIYIDQVFLTWLDDYLSNYFPYFILPFIFNYKWLGLYFHPVHIRTSRHTKISFGSIDAVLKAVNCIGIGLHDELAVETYARLGIRARYFPEICDTTRPERDNLYFKEITQRADGKFVLGTVGPEKRKNALLLVRIAKHYENDSRFFFVFAGQWNFIGYSEAEIKELQEFIGSPFKNTLVFNEYIQEGVNINSLLDAMDVIFITYNNFYSSSNYTTKAAFLKKLVIANDNHIIGEETQKYRLGLTVRENNYNEILESVVKIYDLYTLIQKEALFDKYLFKNSIGQLDNAFKYLLDTYKH